MTEKNLNTRHNKKHSEEGRKNISDGCKKAHALKREKLKNYEIMVNTINIDFLNDYLIKDNNNV